MSRGSPGGAKSLFQNHLPRGGTEGFAGKKMPLPKRPDRGKYEGAKPLQKNILPLSFEGEGD